MKAAEIAAGLKQARRLGEGRYVACCAAHDDSSPSLAITDKNNKTLVHCRAGCSQQEVIAALQSLRLWPSKKPKHPNSPTYYSRDELLGMHCFVEVCKAGFKRGEKLSQAGNEEYKRYLKALRSKGYQV